MIDWALKSHGRRLGGLNKFIRSAFECRLIASAACSAISSGRDASSVSLLQCVWDHTKNRGNFSLHCFVPSLVFDEPISIEILFPQLVPKTCTLAVAECDSLGQGEVGGPVDGVGLPPHIGFP